LADAGELEGDNALADRGGNGVERYWQRLNHRLYSIDSRGAFA
jgi:hypothetical protein